MGQVLRTQHMEIELYQDFLSPRGVRRNCFVQAQAQAQSQHLRNQNLALDYHSTLRPLRLVKDANFSTTRTHTSMIQTRTMPSDYSEERRVRNKKPVDLTVGKMLSS